LLAQDQRLADLLRQRLPPGRREDHALINGLTERLAAGRGAREKFSRATTVFRQAGPGGCPVFEGAAREYLDFLINILGSRRHSLRHVTAELFSAPDWSHVVDQTDTAVAREASLFDRVRENAPAGNKLG
jgi:hypothetical protein